MTVDGLIPAISAVIQAFLLVAGVYIYVSLLRQIAARAPSAEIPPARTFDWPEAIIAILLTSFFLLTLAGASTHNPSRMRSVDLIASGALTVGMLLALAGFLRLRRFDLNLIGGFSRIGFFRTVVTGAILILAAYPLIFLADIVTQRLLRSPPQRQAIVEMFSESTTLEQRILIIVLAVSLAPLAEEFIFRFFIYVIARRYLTRFIAVLGSSLLFSALHVPFAS